MASAHRPTIASHSAMRSVSNSMSWTNAPATETPGSSASRPRNCSRSSGASSCPCTVTACCAAAATSSSGSPVMASVQPTSLGAERQSMIFLVMMISLGTGFVDGAERGLLGPAEPAEPGLRRDLADGFLPGLGTQGIAAGLRAGGRHADVRGERVVDPAHRVEVIRQRVAGQRLDDQPGAVRVERLPDVPGRADRVAHVVQAVEGGDEVIA